MKEKIVYSALENLRKNTGIEGIYTTKTLPGLDGKVDFIFQNENTSFNIEVKREIRNHQLILIEEKAKSIQNFLLVAENIFPKIKAELRNRDIAYLDIAGNIFIQTPKHHLWIDGHKTKIAKTNNENRAYKTTGLKAIYNFLINEELLNQPQRIIAEEIGISLGNVSYILNGLKQLQFLIKKSKKEFQLINKNELLQNWITRYEEKLKPYLHLSNFKFVNRDDERNWKYIEFKKHKTFWGGEPAGNLITNYLQPEEFTIYTEETRNDLIKNYRLIPDQNGNIKVYKKFWQDQDEAINKAVNPILVYADLLNTGNSRCIETANIIYEKHLKQNF